MRHSAYLFLSIILSTVSGWSSNSISTFLPEAFRDHADQRPLTALLAIDFKAPTTFYPGLNYEAFAARMIQICDEGIEPEKRSSKVELNDLWTTTQAIMKQDGHAFYPNYTADHLNSIFEKVMIDWLQAVQFNKMKCSNYKDFYALDLESYYFLSTLLSGRMKEIYESQQAFELIMQS